MNLRLWSFFVPLCFLDKGTLINQGKGDANMLIN